MDNPVDALLVEYEDLLSARAELLLAHSAAWARYGPGGTASLLRYRKEARLKQQTRASNPGWTEQQLKDEVAGSDAWEATLKAIEQGRSQYHEQKAQLEVSVRRLALLTARIRLAGLVVGDLAEGDDASSTTDETS